MPSQISICVRSSPRAPLLPCTPMALEDDGPAWLCAKCHQGVLRPPFAVCACGAEVFVVNGDPGSIGRIPPRGESQCTITVSHVPNGVDVVVAIRTLDEVLVGQAMLLAWSELSARIRRMGVDVRQYASEICRMLDDAEQRESEEDDGQTVEG